MADHARPDEDGWGEPLMPVPRLGRSESGLVPVRWVRSVILLVAGTTIIFTQLVMWVFWEREPVFSLLTVGGGLLAMPKVISLDERRQQQ